MNNEGDSLQEDQNIRAPVFIQLLRTNREKDFPPTPCGIVGELEFPPTGNTVLVGWVEPTANPNLQLQTAPSPSSVRTGSTERIAKDQPSE